MVLRGVLLSDDKYSGEITGEGAGKTVTGRCGCMWAAVKVLRIGCSNLPETDVKNGRANFSMGIKVTPKLSDSGRVNRARSQTSVTYDFRRRTRWVR